jgi:hypothetical protein
MQSTPPINCASREMMFMWVLIPVLAEQAAKENVHWLASFHAEVDYGQAGHKKKPEYQTYNDALAAIKAFEIPPTLSFIVVAVFIAIGH